MGRGNSNNTIWGYKGLKVEEDGFYVRLTAPCGESRRVRPETARKIAIDLLRAAEEVDKTVASLPPITRDPDCVPDVIWFMPPDLVERWAEVARAGWNNVVRVAQDGLLSDTEKAIKEGRIYSIKNFQL